MILAGLFMGYPIESLFRSKALLPCEKPYIISWLYILSIPYFAIFPSKVSDVPINVHQKKYDRPLNLL